MIDICEPGKNIHDIGTVTTILCIGLDIHRCIISRDSC